MKREGVGVPGLPAANGLSDLERSRACQESGGEARNGYAESDKRCLHEPLQDVYSFAGISAGLRENCEFRSAGGIRYVATRGIPTTCPSRHSVARTSLQLSRCSLPDPTYIERPRVSEVRTTTRFAHSNRHPTQRLWIKGIDIAANLQAISQPHREPKRLPFVTQGAP
jgi:hypothetical protein